MSELNSNRLKQELINAGYNNQHLQFDTSKHNALATGTIKWQRLANGLQLHCCDHTENQFGASSVQLEACLSFNILFRGELQFSLGNQHYQLEAEEKRPIAFISNISNNEVFTRFIKQKQHVVKLNVTTPKSWLLHRLKDSSTQTNLNSFMNSTQVVCLTNVHKLIPLANKLMCSDLQKDLCHTLQCEILTLQFVNTNLQLLEQGQFTQCFPNGITSHSVSAKKALECQIKHYILNSFQHIEDVSQIAQHFAISPSTLQRRFKSKHGMTVNECLRATKLEHAKTQLLLSRVSIGEAAYNAGYKHVSNFVSAFTKHFGLPPSQYLRHHSI